ncbi:MAG: fatty acid desaturase [Acidobacteria bacterium]|nr:fatty acid desaturase [Acidobacteriota bacterium]
MSLFWICVITLAIMKISVFMTTIYLHRSLTHRGLELSSLVRFICHLHLALFTGIQPRQWVAVHRKHHQFSDGEGDPHSPLVYGLWTVLLGNALLYRKEAANPATVCKYTPDYREDILDKAHIKDWTALGGLAIFMLMFGWLAGLIAFLAQGAIYILLNSSINSICHVIGYRNFDNQATNVTLIAMLTGGEGYHNNHHEYPTSARFAMRPGELDPAWPVIVALEKLGLAKVNRIPIAKAA